MTYPLSTQRSRTAVIAALLCVFFFSLLSAQTEIPVITDPVTDLTGTLSRTEYSELRSQIMQFQDSTSNQIVILMISTLGGDEIRNYGISVLEKNKIGQKGKDNGILILVAKDDRKLSIESGYGLEGVLTDAVSDQIIRNVIRLQFKEGNYFQALSAGIASIISVTKGEFTGEKKKKKSKDGGWFGLLMIIAVILISVIAGRRGRHHNISSRGSNNIWWGGGGFGGGFGSGGGFGGGFGGGSGGGGWSGGGGSFGGGGASGSW
ncbi:MAG: TPM domain-containing protein [Bacteroidetes bacterium]|nr:TPM domain-containing protein [Bacteroidota bacterium]